MIHIKIILDTAGTFQDVEIVEKPTHIDLYESNKWKSIPNDDASDTIL